MSPTMEPSRSRDEVEEKCGLERAAGGAETSGACPAAGDGQGEGNGARMTNGTDGFKPEGREPPHPGCRPAAERTEADVERQRAAHRGLLDLPTEAFLELPGRPSVLYQLRDYSRAAGFAPPEDPACSRGEGARAAREDLPFLFRAFEAGHPPPPAPGSKEAEAPRASTIHEYLDWTVSAAEANGPDELVRRAPSPPIAMARGGC